MLDFTAQISPFLDAAIVLLALVLVYLLATRAFTRTLLPSAQEEQETQAAIEEEKIVQTRELMLENQLLQQKINQAKKKYLKKKIKAADYRQIVQDAQEKIAQNEGKIRILS